SEGLGAGAGAGPWGLVAQFPAPLKAKDCAVPRAPGYPGARGTARPATSRRSA
ncbi:transcriptional regulator, partial [Streptomyces apricus]